MLAVLPRTIGVPREAGPGYSGQGVRSQGAVAPMVAGVSWGPATPILVPGPQYWCQTPQYWCQTLNNGVQDLNKGVQDLNKGVQDLNKRVQDLNKRVQTLNNGGPDP